jgi:hypothetical protein
MNSFGGGCGERASDIARHPHRFERRQRATRKLIGQRYPDEPASDNQHASVVKVCVDYSKDGRMLNACSPQGCGAYFCGVRVIPIQHQDADGTIEDDVVTTP